MKNKRNLKEEQGITLIALIITIIVLVILAAVAITTAYNTGIIEYAIKGTEDYAKQAINENKVMEETADKMSSTISKIESIVNSPPEPNEIAKEYGKKQEIENKTITLGSKTITIPKGYAVVNPTKDTTIEYVEENNPQIDEGIVITDKVDGDGKSIGNEFVWVPVENINDMVMCQKHPSAEIKFDKTTEKFTCSTHGSEELKLAGKLYATSTGNSFNANTSNKTYYEYGLREPTILNDMSYGDKVENDDSKGIRQLKSTVGIQGETTEEVINNWNTELQEKFNEMAKSVGKYGGFYIGRYETGILQAEDAEVPVVQKYNTNIANVNWYWQYKNSKSIAKEGTGATSSMIWGCQWDATMKWFISCGLSDYVSQSKVGEEVKGNYYDTELKYRISAEGEEQTKNANTSQVIPTGGSEQTKVKNIYDMAGNVYDWTIEAYSTDDRVTRGGRYSDTGSSSPASLRDSWEPYRNGSNVLGGRTTLYIN